MAKDGSTASWREQSARLVGDLLTIEVDVVVDADLARPAPTDDATTAATAATAATIDHVAGVYRRWLDEHAPDAAAAVPGGEPAVDLAGRLRRIADDAARAEAALADLPAAGGGDRAMLRRIGGNAAQLVAALDRGDAGRVDLARIGRKAWELGTSEIVAQSVVQLDGDVVVRVDESLLTDDAASLHELHRRALGAALTHWRTLFEFVVQMAVGAAGLLSALWRSRRASIASLRRWLTTRRSAERSPAMSVRELLRGDERKRVVAAFRQLRDELLAGGGHAIETTSADGAVVARTVVQPDGDVLWFVSPDALADGSVLDAHVAAVVGWYERSGELVATLQRYLSKAQELARVVLGLVAAAAGVVVGGALRSPLAALLSFAGFAVVAGAVMLLLRSAIGRRLRRGIGRAG